MELCSFPSFPKVWDLSAGGQGVGGRAEGRGTEQWQWPISELLQLSLMTAAYAEARGSKEQKTIQKRIWCQQCNKPSKAFLKVIVEFVLITCFSANQSTEM